MTDRAGKGGVPPRRAPCLVELALDGREVGEHELELEHAERLEGVGDAGDCLVGKAPQHKAQGVDLADPGEEAVAEPFAALRAGDESGNVHELDARLHHLLRLAHDGERGETLVRDVRDADCALRRGERVRTADSATPARR